MSIKKHTMILFTAFVSIIFVVFISPACAEMKKVDEAELARTNVSVTGETLKDQVPNIEKNLVNQDTTQINVTVDKNDSFISPTVKAMESIGISLNVNGQETFKFGFSGYSSTVTGSIGNVKSR